MPYFLDSNIIMYASGKPHFYRRPCQEIIKAIGENRISVVSSTEILQEILYRYLSLNRKKDALDLTNDTIELSSAILPIQKEDILKAMELIELYPKLECRDAIHAATMINNNIKEIISIDTAFDVIAGIRRIDPVKSLF